MSVVDSLILDAKKAILEEQHRRFEALRRDGQWEDALRQLQVTLHCAADLLTHSTEMLHHLLPNPDHRAGDADAPSGPPINS